MRFRFLCAVCTLIALASCGYGHAPAWEQAPGGVAGALLPALPRDAPASAKRQPSANSQLIPGDGFFNKGGTTVDLPGQLQLNPLYQELAYAVYQFPVEPGDDLQQLAYYVTDRDMVSIKVWIAIANYQRQCWEFLPALAQDSKVYTLSGPSSAYTSPGGNFYAALFAYSVGGFKINGVELWKDNLSGDTNSWAMFGRDPARTHRARAEVVPQMNVLWKSRRATQFIAASPVVNADGELFIASWTAINTGALYALDAAGSELWHYDLTDYVASSPALAPDGSVYVACHDGALYCLNHAGDLRWSFVTSRELTSSPLVGPDGMVYFGSVNANVYCVNPLGQQVWECATGAGVYGAPALASNGFTFCTNAQGKLVAIDTAGGQDWVFSGAGRAEGATCIGTDGTAYFATQEGNVYAVFPDGTLRGSYSAGGSFIAAPALDSTGQLWIGNMNGKLYRLNADASLSGTFTATAGIECSVALDSTDHVCFASNDGHVYVLNPDLSLQWEYQADETIRSSCCISADGVLYFAGTGGTIYAFGPNAALPPAAPTGLSASDGTQVGQVQLTWDEGYDANGYEIYKDGGLDPVASVGYVQHWEDAVGDLDPHDYQLKAVNEYGSSGFSNVDAGFAAATAELSSWALYRANPAQTNCAPVPGPAATPVETVIDLGPGRRPGPVAFAPDGSFYLVDAAGQYHSFSPAGVPGWTYAVAESEPLSPALGPAGESFVHVSAEIHALDNLGAFQWSYMPWMGSGLTIAGLDAAGRLYVSSYTDAQLRCVAPDGSEAWAYDPGCDNNYTNCAVGSDGAVYFADGKFGLVALQADGTFAWRFPDEVATNSEPCIRLDAIAGDLIYINSSQGLACLDASGAVQWYAHDMALTPVAARPTLAPDGTIFSVGGNYLKAINPDGLLRLQITLPNQASATAIAADSLSNVYIATNSAVQSYDSQLVQRWTLNVGGDLTDATVVIGPEREAVR